MFVECVYWILGGVVCGVLVYFDFVILLVDLIDGEVFVSVYGYVW